MSLHPAAAVLFAQLAEPFTGEAVFDGLPDLVYFVKNLRGEYVVVNETLVSRSAAKSKADLIGLTAAQVFPPPLGRLYHEQDCALLATGKPFVNQLELHLYASGATGWCLTTKQPLRDRRGGVIGLVGISKDLQTPAAEASGMDQIATAIRHLQTHLAEPLTVTDLAQIARLSAYQLDQRCRKVFHLTVGQLMTKLRMDAAALRLRETDDSLGAIAHDCGYADQSAFTRQFRRTTGLTPAVYRRSQRA